MPTLDALDKKLDTMAEDVVAVKTALKGYDGQVGLCKQVERNSKAIAKLWICIIILALSIGGGTFGLVKAVLAIAGG